MGQMVERKTNSGEENEAPFKEGYILDINKFYKADETENSKSQEAARNLNHTFLFNLAIECSSILS